MLHRNSGSALAHVGALVMLVAAGCGDDPRSTPCHEPLLRGERVIQGWNAPTAVAADDGGFYLLGTPASDEVARAEANGDIRWHAVASADVWLKSGALLDDGGLVLAGRAVEGLRLWLGRIDDRGELGLERVLEQPVHFMVWGHIDVARHADGGFVISTHSGQDETDSALWLHHVDAQLEEVWSLEHPLVAGSVVAINWSRGDMVATANGDYVQLTSTVTTDGGHDLRLVRTAADGTVRWDRELISQGDDYPQELGVTADGDLLILENRMDIGMVLVRTDPDGEPRWDQVISPHRDESASGMALAGDDTVYVAGVHRGLDGGAERAWLFTVDPTTGWRTWEWSGPPAERSPEDFTLLSDGRLLVTGRGGGAYYQFVEPPTCDPP